MDQSMRPELKGIIEIAAMRWLNSIQLNSAMASFGCCDREFWAWKTKDFANGTCQAGLAGFLDSRELLPLDEADVKLICSAVVRGTAWIQRSNGSFEEAYPYESSYAVTGLLLFELLYSALKYPQYFAECSDLLGGIVDKATRFLESSRETHGIISNHVCTTVMALEMARRWRAPEPFRWSANLHNFLKLQDPEEGWFPEYDGADPGYQTLLNSYLVRGYRTIGMYDEGIEKALQRSFVFCQRFCFPTGAFAGEIGSRGTAVVYPAGLLFTRDASSKLWFGEKYLKNIGGVNPLTVDIGNFVPLFNSWASLLDLRPLEVKEITGPATLRLERARMVFETTPQSTSVVSLKTGAQRLFVQDNHEWKDLSMVGVNVGAFNTHAGKSTGTKMGASSGEPLEIAVRLGRTVDIYNSWAKAIVIRVIARAIFPFPFLQRVFKSMLARVVMSGSTPRGPTLKIFVSHFEAATAVPSSNSGDLKVSPKSFGFDRHMASGNYFPQQSQVGREQ